MCTMPSTPNRNAAQPIGLPARRPLCWGSRRLRQATKTSRRGRTSHQADRPGDDAAHGVEEPAGQLPPDGRGDDDGEPTRNSPAPSRRCSGSSSPAELPHASYATADEVRRAQPDAGDRTRPGRRTAGRPATARSAPPAAPDASSRFRGAGLRLLVVFLPVERDREVEPPFSEVPLLRDAVGEDVRVAMVANVRENLTCPMRHTPGVVVGRGESVEEARQPPRWSSSERQRAGVETTLRLRVVIG